MRKFVRVRCTVCGTLTPIQKYMATRQYIVPQCPHANLAGLFMSVDSIPKFDAVLMSCLLWINKWLTRLKR